MTQTTAGNTGGDSAPLGSTTKFASSDLEKDPVVRRYYLQALARELLPHERVALCMRTIKIGRNTVDILHNPQTNKARYKGLIRCASIWNCPVCASVITERRRKELTEALGKSKYVVAMVTYTIRHNRKEPLTRVLEILSVAYRSMKSGREIVEIREEYQWIGSIRALEVTVGDNGWHPHLHELVLFETLDSMTAGRLESVLRKRWIEMVKRAGGSATLTNGLSVIYGDDERITQYVEKYGRTPKESRWSLEHELTKAPTKRGRESGRTPVELLIDYGQGDKQAGAFYVEYANAFKGRSQLQWSRGLRALLGMDETTDEGILEQEESEAGNVLATLSAQQWRLVVQHHKRGELLKIASTGDVNAVHEFLFELEHEQGA